ncbi:hypothetical protein APHAL10511_002788 [Amanita phalloides]|nr:hypothetical protein APHAL10511_002788 [Amanita phalloides]
MGMGAVEQSGPNDEEVVVSGAPVGTRLKRKLEEAFGGSKERAQKLTTQMYANKIAKVKVFSQVLEVVGNGCGYCYAMGNRLPEEHGGQQCTLMSTEKHRQYRHLAEHMSYTKSQGMSRKLGRACFWCHVSSLGHNALHPEMVKGERRCKNKNLVLPLAFAVYMNEGLKREAKLELIRVEEEGEWIDIAGYARWLVLKDEEFGTKGMAVLEWYIRQRGRGAII